MKELVYIVEFDASLLVKVYNQGLTDGFALAVETSELDQQLNINQIDEAEEL